MFPTYYDLNVDVRHRWDIDHRILVPTDYRLTIALSSNVAFAFGAAAFAFAVQSVATVFQAIPAFGR